MGCAVVQSLWDQLYEKMTSIFLFNFTKLDAFPALCTASSHVGIEKYHKDNQYIKLGLRLPAINKCQSHISCMIFSLMVYYDTIIIIIIVILLSNNNNNKNYSNTDNTDELYLRVLFACPLSQWTLQWCYKYWKRIRFSY